MSTHDNYPDQVLASVMRAMLLHSDPHTVSDAVLAVPVPMILHCPACGLQHVDAPDTNYDPHYEGHMIWTNPPHRSHLCAGCGHIWRPADVPTTGVQAISTRGTSDSPPVAPLSTEHLRAIVGTTESGREFLKRWDAGWRP